MCVPKEVFVWELIDAARGTDRVAANEAWEQLVEMYVDPIVSIVRRQTRLNVCDAESVAFDSMLIAVPRFCPTRGTFDAYLTTIAIRAAYRLIANQPVLFGDPMRIASFSAADQVQVAVAREVARRLEEWLAQRDPDDQLVLCARYRDWADEQVGRRLGITVNAVRLRRLKLYRELVGHLNGE